MVSDLLQIVGMTAIASAMQQKFRGGAVGFRAASARSEKDEFTVWARSAHSPRNVRTAAKRLRQTRERLAKAYETPARARYT